MNTNIVSKTKKRSFLKDIHLGGAFKVFIILLLIFILFFCIWILIKPTKKEETIGISALPAGGIIIPVDDSKCGIDIIPCSGFSCDESCPVGTGASNYSCQQIQGDVWYLGTQLPKGKSFCLPKESEPVVNSCGTYTGRVIRVEDENNSLSWACQCKYPTMYGGPNCTDQVACSYMDFDQDGNEVLKFAQLMMVDRDRNPILDNKGNKIYYTLTTEQYTPVDVYDNDPSKPVWVCDCNANGIGRISLTNDPYSCHLDPCYAGQGSSSAYFDEKTQSCICGPNTGKSNITQFCYPISSKCIPSYTGECTYGFLGQLEQTNGPTQNLIFSWKGDIYIAINIPVTNQDTYYTYLTWDNWMWGGPGGSVLNVSNVSKDQQSWQLIGSGNNAITINCSMTGTNGDTILYDMGSQAGKDKNCTSSNQVDMFNNYNLQCNWGADPVISPVGVTGANIVNLVTAVKLNTPGFQKDFPVLYNSLISLGGNIVSLDNSLLNNWVQIIGQMTYENYKSLLSGNSGDLSTAVSNSISSQNYTSTFLKNILNNANPFKIIPQYCNTIYSDRGVNTNCSDYSFNSISNNPYNPIGIVGVDYANPDFCGQKEGYGTILLDAFTSNGISCVCNAGYKLDPTGTQCVRDCKSRGDNCDPDNPTECCSNACIRTGYCDPNGCYYQHNCQ